jgi:hypothetical protein
VQQLEAATEEARQANIGVAKAKRVLKELQAQVGVAGLGALRGNRPASGPLMQPACVEVPGCCFLSILSVHRLPP